jgi:hypothetical protein
MSNADLIALTQKYLMNTYNRLTDRPDAGKGSGRGTRTARNISISSRVSPSTT